MEYHDLFFPEPTVNLKLKFNTFSLYSRGQTARETNISTNYGDQSLLTINWYMFSGAVVNKGNRKKHLNEKNEYFVFLKSLNYVCIQ